MQFIIPHTKLAVESTGSNLPPVPREHSDRKKQPSTLEEGQSSESQDTNRDVDGDDDLVSLDVQESQNDETDHNRPTINPESRQYSSKREKPLGSTPGDKNGILIQKIRESVFVEFTARTRSTA